MDDKTSSATPLVRAVACVWAVVVVSWAVVSATDIFLLSVSGVLFAILLTRTSSGLSRWTGLGYRFSVAVVTLALLLTSVGTVYLFGRQIEIRVSNAASQASEVAAEIRHWINEHALAATAMSGLPFFDQLLGEQDGNSRIGSSHHEGIAEEPASSSPRQTPRTSDADADHVELAESTSTGRPSIDGSSFGMVWSLISGLFQTTFGVVMNLAVVVFVGVFLAIDPNLYRNGVVRLFLPNQRRCATRILDQIGVTLWHWMLGRFASMVITGVGTGIALAFIGIPLPWMLGLLTGLLTFIPNLGPAIGLAMAVLVSLPTGGMTTLLVILVFLAFQLVESYVLTPLIQQQQVQIPPAVLIVWQVLLGMLAGMLGVLVSTPILAMIFVIVKGVYLDEVTGDAGPKEVAS